MQLSRSDERFKHDLESAATALRDASQPDHATTVETVLTPIGAALVARQYADRTNMPISVTRVERQHYAASVEKSDEALGLSVLADQALYEFSEGSFRPEAYTRAISRGEPSDLATLTVTVDKTLRGRATGLLKDPQFTKDLGWKPQSAAIIVRLWLQQRFPLFAGLNADGVIAAYGSGDSLSKLAKQHDVREDLIALLLTNNGILLRERQDFRDALGGCRRQLSRPEVDEVIRRYTVDQAGTYVLAREFGVAPNTIIRLLDRKGIERRPTRGKKSKPE
ncbi:hypothetical protein [Streptomyces sp. WAC01526]|uniref:hypothetical protein n=1 Tax=Streptomyces sp. WAC01526 TaxID=2588709 RepID=UPI0011DF1A33|nr:hypothetical protein [Streptomyces sp. WAC01526]